MLTHLVRTLLPKNTSPTTYGLGILQSTSYRVLKTKTASYLAGVGLTTIDWAILGTLADTSLGLSLSELSDHLGVKSPLVTVRTARLLKLDLIERNIAKTDSRSRIVTLSKRGIKLVPKIERALRDTMKPLFEGCSIRDLMGFVRVMSIIADSKNKE